MKMLTARQLFGGMQFYKECWQLESLLCCNHLYKSLVSLIDGFMVSGLGGYQDVRCEYIRTNSIYLHDIARRSLYIRRNFPLHEFSEQRIKKGCGRHLRLRL